MPFNAGLMSFFDILFFQIIILSLLIMHAVSGFGYQHGLRQVKIIFGFI